MLRDLLGRCLPSFLEALAKRLSRRTVKRRRVSRLDSGTTGAKRAWGQSFQFRMSAWCRIRGVSCRVTGFPWVGSIQIFGRRLLEPFLAAQQSRVVQRFRENSVQ